MTVVVIASLIQVWIVAPTLWLTQMHNAEQSGGTR